MALLRRHAEEIGRDTGCRELFEIGPGSAEKALILLDGLVENGRLESYLALEISRAGAEDVVARIRTAHPDLSCRAEVGDFLRDLGAIAPRHGRLAAFLGSTLGNLPREGQVPLLRSIRATLGRDSHLLLGTDLVKEVGVLEAAYNDAAGVTQKFNRNVLRMINDRLSADFDPEQFDHVARFDPESSAVESHLVARRALKVRIADLDMELALEEGERIHMESSRKYTRAMVEELLDSAGLELVAWITDARGWYALSLSRPA